jgi:hypothetical protein
MPIEYELDAESQLLLISYLGPITHEEILEHRAALENDARGVLRYSTIVDLRYGTIAMSPEQIRDLARAARDKAWPPSRCALVTPHERLFGDMRMFEQWAETGPRQYRTFRTFRDACAWLGVTRCPQCGEDEAPSP